MIFIRSVLFNIWIIMMTVIIGGGLIPLILGSAKFVVNSVGKWWATAIIWGAKYICGIKMEVRGLENLPPTPFIVAAKHQSAWETLSLFVLVKYPAFVIKKELLAVPFIGQYGKRCRFIIVDRKAGSKALKSLIRQTKARLREGRNVIIFPEGTRTKPGESGSYNPGVAAMYSHGEVPLVPVALNSGLYWGKNSFLKYPGKIVIEFLKPIPPGELRRDQVAEELASRIEPATRALEKEGLESLGKNENQG